MKCIKLNLIFKKAISHIGMCLALAVLAACSSKPAPSKHASAHNKSCQRYYKVAGQNYCVYKTAKGYNAKGTASWYGKKFHGKKTASGEKFNMYKLSAAHPSLPLGTKVKVRNLDNNKTIVLKINDRGPFRHDRIIDLSYVAAKKLGYDKKGTARVQVTSLS